jgi:NgoMIV restriction enzyme
MDGILTISEKGIPTIADSGSKISVEIACQIVDRIGKAHVSKKGAGQTAGSDFESACAEFVNSSFCQLPHVRPGTFTVTKGGSIAQFDQYSHLDEIEAIAKKSKEIATALGSDYIIKPDIVVSKLPFSDEELNAHTTLVDSDSANLSPLRACNQEMATLHASISCKWTLRSDRAQNARSEGLNLVRNRKGRLPHVVAITAEPMPSRIASLALGTGDIDCVYHFALPELRDSLIELKRDDALDMLDTMVAGKRLRDISDLPLDLAI